MISFLVGVVFALLRQWLVSRLFLWLLRSVTPFRRLQLAHAAAYFLIVAACTYGLPFSGPPRLLAQAGLNLGPAVLWWACETLVLMRQQAKVRDAVYISRMR